TVVLSNELLLDVASAMRSVLGLNFVPLTRLSSVRSDKVNRACQFLLDRVATGLCLYGMGYARVLDAVATHHHRVEKLGRLIVMIEYAKDLKMESLEAMMLLADRLGPIVGKQRRRQRKKQDREAAA